MLGSNHYKENDRIVAEIVWWAPRVAEQLRSICTRVREKLATRSAQLLASLDPARLGGIERDWTQKSTARITPLRCERKTNAWTLKHTRRIVSHASGPYLRSSVSAYTSWRLIWPIILFW